MNLTRKVKAIIQVEFTIPDFLDDPYGVMYKTPREHAENLAKKISFREPHLNPSVAVLVVEDVPIGDA